MGYLVQSWYWVGLWIKESLPIWMRPQRRDNGPSVSLKVDKNMNKLVSRGYITKVVILVLTSFFSLPKGIDDIRMMFDATVSVLNGSLWAPNFMLPSMGSFIMMVGPETHMVDLDIGEMFYNFRLSSLMAKYCGVGLGSDLGHKKYRQVTPLWMLWLHLMMGLVLYPYSVIQGLFWASEVVRGDRSDPDNSCRR